MRNKIEIKHNGREQSSFIEPTSSEFLKPGRAIPASIVDAARTPGVAEPARFEPKAFQERTSNPLKIVFIARIEPQCSDKSVSACRRLAAALTGRGHRLLILERNGKRKHEPPLLAQTVFYDSVKDLKERFAPAIRSADFVMVSSNVPEGATIGDWLTQIAQGATAFYDLNTPLTLSKLERGESECISRSLIGRYQLYLSLTGGPLLELIQRYYGAPLVRPLYGSVDTSAFYPERAKAKWDLGYAGNFDEDRLPGIDELLLEPARHWTGGHFALAGHGFLKTSDWPGNAKRLGEIAAGKERAFYNAQRFTLNVTGADMIEAGFSPSLQIFEAAACGTPIISDYWEDLETFFAPDEEILFARSAEEVLDILRGIGEDERLRIGDNARHRILQEHSAEQRVLELEAHVSEAMAKG
jgi:spore maturation protein CgeB